MIALTPGALGFITGERPGAEPGAAEAVAAPLGARAVAEPAELFSDPQLEAIVIAASSAAHTRLILAAIAAGKAVFCEKPMAETLEDADRAIAAAKAAGLPLQVGFNRRFARAFREAHDVIAAGGIGTPQLLRSLTRDPGLANPGGGSPVDNLHPDPHPRLRCPQLAQPERRGRGSLRHGRCLGRPGL